MWMPDIGSPLTCTCSGQGSYCTLTCYYKGQKVQGQCVGLGSLFNCACITGQSFPAPLCWAGNTGGSYGCGACTNFLLKSPKCVKELVNMCKK